MPGKIKTIGQILDPETRTVNALIEIPIYRGELVGNMFANVQVDVELNDYLMVPQEALMDTGTRKVVFVKESSNQFTPREVVVGALGDNGWGIKSGIKVGDQVVVAGNFLLDSESKMQATLDGGHDHD
jgi:Cu(I)/Ag(I) efflux system membrane fusion protein